MQILSRHEQVAQYNEYLTQHISAVKEAFNQFAPYIYTDTDLTVEEVGDLEDEIAQHDASKYEDDEYEAYLNHFYPQDGSEISEDDAAFDEAWLLHQHRNSHHWQYWVLVRDSGETVPLDMPEKSIIHMLCDWHSFSKRDSESTAARWWRRNKDKMILSTNTRSYIDRIIKRFDNPLM